MDAAHYSNSNLAIFCMVVGVGLAVAIGWLVYDINRDLP